MDNSKPPATGADLAALRGEMQELEAKMENRFQEFVEHVESLFKRMEQQIVATIYRLGDAAQMRLTEAEREAAAVKERLSALEARLLELERLVDMKTGRVQ